MYSLPARETAGLLSSLPAGMISLRVSFPQPIWRSDLKSVYLYRWMKSFVQGIFKAFYLSYAFLVFLLLMFLVLPFVAVAALMGGERAGNFIFRLCNFWADIWLGLSGIRSRVLHEVPFDKDRHYIYVANHIAYLDAAIIARIMRRPIRILARAESSRIPFFGFIYRHATVTVDRSSPANRANSVRVLKAMLGHRISIFIFPEGTFNMTGRPLKDFYDGAFRIAIETQTPIKPVLLLDTFERMQYDSIFNLNPGICRSVFLDEVPVEGLEASDVATLKDNVYRLMEQKLIAYKAGWIRSE